MMDNQIFLTIISVNFVIHLLFWIFGFLFLFRITFCKRTTCKISSHKISIIIPARNEEYNLPKLLQSIRHQDLAPEEIIVVDDFSEDRTKAIAIQAGVKILPSAPNPKEWKGKSWACYQGAQIAQGDILIFLDADTTLEKDGLQRIVETYLKLGGILSIQPYHKMKLIYEELSLFFNIIVVSAIASFTVFGNRIKPAGLFGPAMIVSKQIYFQYGGHSSVKREIMENMAYGSLFKNKGGDIYSHAGRHTISFRMYPRGIIDLINGWSKGFASGAVKTSIPILIIIVLWIIGALGTTRNLIQELFLGDTLQTMLWSLLYICYVLQIYWMARRIGNFKVYTAIFYPIPLLFFILIFIYSFLRVFIVKKTVWKGRTINT